MPRIEEAKSGRHSVQCTDTGDFALCIIERLSQLGPGARAAGERRKVVLRLKKQGSGNYRNTTLHLETEDSAELVEHLLPPYASL